jgi:flagellar protein FliO/FliZ
MESDMQFMTALFGGSAGTLINAIFSLGIVLALIVLGLWLLKLLTRASSKLGRSTDKRLEIVDTAAIDGKRKVIIIRRDNVEHLVMTGGPTDVVIESGIQVATGPGARHPGHMRGETAAPARSPEASDIAAPIAPDRPVSRDTVDRLNDLTRPAPLKPRVALRHTALLRPVSSDGSGVIPIGPELRVDNSAGPNADSARSGASEQTGGKVGLGGRNRFFRSIARDRS